MHLKFRLVWRCHNISESGCTCNMLVSESGRTYNMLVSESGRICNMLVSESGRMYNTLVSESGRTCNMLVTVFCLPVHVHKQVRGHGSQEQLVVRRQPSHSACKRNSAVSTSVLLIV